MNNKKQLMDDINEIVKEELKGDVLIKVLPESREEIKNLEFNGKKIIAISITNKEERIRFIIDLVSKEIEIITNIENKIIIQKLEVIIKKMAKIEAMKNLY